LISPRLQLALTLATGTSHGKPATNSFARSYPFTLFL
jgi:hypothetical protein